MNTVRFGIIGMGNAGTLHARAILEGRVPGANLTAVAAKELGGWRPPDGVRVYRDYRELLADKVCDAVIVASPHPLHPEQTVAALESGHHVLCEKPAGVRTREARMMNAAAQRSGKCYAMNFNRRTSPLYAAIRQVVREGTLGRVRRVAWTSTNWLRVQSYYDGSSWRGTWRGEGGGLLLNQLPHALDLWPWIFGLPRRLVALCQMGKYHAIEVEDEIHVLGEYADGMVVALTGSSGEAPGVERVEVVGDRASLRAEDGRLTLTFTEPAVAEMIRSAPTGFPQPKTRCEVCTPEGEEDLVAGITRDFISAILHGTPLLAPGDEGLSSLMLANAALLSTWRGEWVSLPVDEDSFHQQLDQRIARSSLRRVAAAQVVSLEDSFR